MKINPKATYRLGVMRSDSHPQDPDPRLVNPQTVSGMQLTNAGIFEWEHFFMQNPLNIQKKGTIEVFSVGARGDLKHTYSGSFFSQPGFSPYDQQGAAMHNGYGQPMPIGMSGLSNQLPGRGVMPGMMPNQTEAMQTVFSNANIQMEKMEERHRDEIERMKIQLQSLQDALRAEYDKNSDLRAELKVEHAGRIKAEQDAEKIKFEYEVKERESKRADEDSVKMAKEYVDTQKKQSNALNDGSMDKIAGLISSALQLVQGTSPNVMQPSIPPQQHGMADANKAPQAPPNVHPMSGQHPVSAQRPPQAPPPHAANLHYQ
jgi:hypothetical protein